MAGKAKTKKNYEQMIGELEQLLSEMEQGDLSLDDMLGHYAAGVELIKQCRDKLTLAEETVKQ